MPLHVWGCQTVQYAPGSPWFAVIYATVAPSDSIYHNDGFMFLFSAPDILLYIVRLNVYRLKL